jgi:hypothetical protein
MYTNAYENSYTKHAIIDYIDRGMWGLCLATREAAREGMVDEIIDKDTDLNSLILRAVKDWGCNPHELWVSECAREIVSYSLNDKNIGE